MTSWPLSSFTRQRASGRTSSTTPSNSSISSLAMQSPRSGPGGAPSGPASTYASGADLRPVYGPCRPPRQAKTGAELAAADPVVHAAVIACRRHRWGAAASGREQQVASQVVDVGHGLQRRLQPVAVAAREALHLDGVGWRDAGGQVRQLLGEEEVEERPLRLRQGIEVLLAAAQRLDPRQPGRGRALDHVVADG